MAKQTSQNSRHFLSESIKGSSKTMGISESRRAQGSCGTGHCSNAWECCPYQRRGPDSLPGSVTHGLPMDGRTDKTKAKRFSPPEGVLLNASESLVPQRLDRVEICGPHCRKHSADHSDDSQDHHRDQQDLRLHDQANVARLGMLCHGAVQRE